MSGRASSLVATLALLGPPMVGLLLGALAPADWRAGATSALAAALWLLLRRRPAGRVAMAFGYANLAAAAATHGSDWTRAAALVLALLLLLPLVRRRGHWPDHLLPTVAVAGGVASLVPFVPAALSTAWAGSATGLEHFHGAVAAFASCLLFFAESREDRPPAWPLAAGLFLSALTGALALAQASDALAAATASPDPARVDRASELSRKAGWAQGEREARILGARHDLATGHPARALARLPPEHALTPEEMWLRAEALLGTGQHAKAMALLRNAAAEGDDVPHALSPEAGVRAGLWALRSGRTKPATALLERGLGQNQVPIDGWERYQSELVALRLRTGDAAGARIAAAWLMSSAPDGDHATCAFAEVEDTTGAARACLARVPAHGPSLRRIALAGDPEASRILARSAELPPRDVSFDGVIRLRGVRLGAAQARPGGELPVELAFEVTGTCAAGERYVIFVHFDGPTHFDADHLVPIERHSPSWVRGELFRYSVTARIPTGAPAGRYSVHLGLHSPESGARLHPVGQPGHIQFVDLGRLEVLP